MNIDSTKNMEIFTDISYREWLKQQITNASSDEFIRIRAELGAEADICMKHPLYSVTYTKTRAVSQDPHDYYSEGPYWWPDPQNPGGPFIRRDGEVYPGCIRDHGRDMGRMVRDVYILSAAGYYLGRTECTVRADEILRTWFINEATKMNPHLNYAQAIFGHTEGRGIGIIDTVSLIKLIAAMEFFTGCSGIEATTAELKEWFRAYLTWMNTSKNGIEERDHNNNHATWWNAQAAAYAAFIGDKTMLDFCFDRLINKILPSQAGPDGSFDEELKRTKSFSYSMYNLEACTVTAEVAYHCGIDLWNAVSADGKSIQGSLDFMLPYYENPALWQHKQIAADFGSPSVSFQLAAVRINDKYAKAAKQRCTNLRYFGVLTDIGAPCLFEGFF